MRSRTRDSICCFNDTAKREVGERVREGFESAKGGSKHGHDEDSRFRLFLFPTYLGASHGKPFLAI